jgi:RNA polymerase sigma factor (TIGR02999 family)
MNPLAGGPASGITCDLRAWRGGDPDALARLTPRVYAELRRLARIFSSKERAGHSLQATDLVHEAYLRLVDVDGVDWRDRAHFFAVAAQMMRRILVDAARARACAKRGGRLRREDHSTTLALDQVAATMVVRDRQLVAIDDSLNALAAMDPRKARVIELRFFGGLSVEETAEILKISEQSVMRDWKLAKAWLQREVGAGTK